MPDIKITCVECKKEFVFAERDQQFFREKGYTNPKRCKACRKEKKANKAGYGKSK